LRFGVLFSFSDFFLLSTLRQMISISEDAVSSTSLDSFFCSRVLSLEAQLAQFLFRLFCGCLRRLRNEEVYVARLVRLFS